MGNFISYKYSINNYLLIYREGDRERYIEIPSGLCSIMIGQQAGPQQGVPSTQYPARAADTGYSNYVQNTIIQYSVKPSNSNTEN